MRSLWTLLAVLLLCLAACDSVGGSPDRIDGGFGTPCQATTDCSPEYACIHSFCGLAGTVNPGGPCSASRDCASGNYCTILGVCAPASTGEVGDTCTGDGDCGQGLRCDFNGFSGHCANSGTTEIGADCTTNDDCLAALYCGASQKCQPLVVAFPLPVDVTCTDDADYKIYFQVPRPTDPLPDFYRLPFPNDARVSTSGDLDMSDFPVMGPTFLGIDLVKFYVDALVRDFDGFSSTAVVSFRFSATVKFATLMAENAIRIIDLTPGPTFGSGPGWSGGFTSGRTKYSCSNMLYIHPSLDTPLAPRHTYAIILSTALTSMDGVPPQQDADFAAVLSSQRPTDDTDTMGHAWDVYAPLRDYISAQAIDPTTIAAASLFTVQDTTGHMQRLAADANAQPAPTLKSLTLCEAGVTSPCDDGTPARACGAPSNDFYEIHGKYTVPIYQAGEEPYLSEGGNIVENAAGQPQVQRTEDVCFALTVPKGTMPDTGWPLVVYHHGTGGSMRSFIDEGIAGAMARAGSPVAVFGFDAVEHGARRGSSTVSSDDLVFNPLNPPVARDNFLQGAVDILTAFRVADLPVDVAHLGTGTIRFDKSKLTYFGHSQGSTSGALAVAFSDAAPVTIFSGGGAFLTASLLSKTSPVDIKAGMKLLIGDDKLDQNHPAMVIFQTYFDRSDPINYNGLIIKSPPEGLLPKNVFMSWGTGDTFTPKDTLVRFARALGLPPVMPVLEDYNTPAIARPVQGNLKTGTVTGAVFQYAPGSYDGHFVAMQNASAVMDWTAFVQSWLADPTMPPNVP